MKVWAAILLVIAFDPVEAIAADPVDRRSLTKADRNPKSCPVDPERWLLECGGGIYLGKPPRSYVIATKPDEGFFDVGPSRYYPAFGDSTGAKPLLDTSKIWAETEVGTASYGYDPATNRTLLKVYNIAAIGPDSVHKTAAAILQKCAGGSLVAAQTAFNMAQPPDIGTRVGKAYAAFKIAAYECLSNISLVSEARDKFEIGYVERAIWVDGLVIEFSMKHQMADVHQQLYDMISDDVPEPINNVVSFALAHQRGPDIKLKMDPPPEMRHVLKALPSIQKLQEFQANAQAKATELGHELIAAATNEVKQVAEEARDEVERVLLRSIELPDEALVQAVKGADDLWRQSKRVVALDLRRLTEIRPPSLPDEGCGDVECFTQVVTSIFKPF